MKYLLICTLLLLHAISAHAQTPNNAGSRVEIDRFMVDANGRVLKPSGDYNEEGSPYFSKEFLPGSVTILKGQTYHGLQLKINFHTNEIIFLDAAGNEMVVAQPVERVELNTTNGTRIFKSGYQSIDEHDTHVFYEVIDSGSTSFLKYTEMSFSERQPYPNARYVRTYRDRIFYYAARGNQLQRLPKTIEEVPALFPGKEGKLEAFIKKEKLKLKKEDHMVQLFRYANQL